MQCSGSASSGFPTLSGLTDGFNFHSLVPSFSKLVDLQTSRKDWSTRFCLAFHNYHSGQVELAASNSELKAHGGSSTLDQGVDAFLGLRRKIGGWDILFLLHEALEDIRYEAATDQELNTLEEIMTLTGDTLSWILVCSHLHTFTPLLTAAPPI